MFLVENLGIHINKFKSLDELGVDHGIFTRRGGVSQSPWSTLNFGGTVGDNPDDVRANHDLAFKAAGFTRFDIFDAWQVHGTVVLFPNKPRFPGVPHQKGDILLTDQSDITLFMRFADCVPILLYDRRKNVCGLIHAGWQGTVKKAVRTAISSMCEHFQSSPADIVAAIGPSIGPDHYEIGPNVANQVREAFDTKADQVLISNNGGQKFDLWKANRILLEDAGVGMIEEAQICTYCDEHNWFSHRRDHGKTGRFGAYIRIADH